MRAKHSFSSSSVFPEPCGEVFGEDSCLGLSVPAVGLCICSHPLQEEASLTMTEQGTFPPVQYLTVRGSNKILPPELL